LNKLQRKLKEKQTYEKYHTPSSNEFVRRTKNAVFLNPANHLSHELKKLEICYEFRKVGINFITEAVKNSKVDGKEKRVDIINLIIGDEVEIINKHETDFEIKKYRENGVIPIMVNPMVCKICGFKYPKRNKNNVCQICKKMNEALKQFKEIGFWNMKSVKISESLQLKMCND